MNQAESSSTNIPAAINIVMVQDAFQVGDIKCNADKIIAAAIKASQQGADLVVFPELALVGYPPEDLLHRQGFLRQTEQESLRIGQSLKESIGDTGVVFGLPYEHAGNLYNAAVYLTNGMVKQFCFKQSYCETVKKQRCTGTYSIKRFTFSY
jgi:NAD+ synthase (glutamine-hydrolysing)